MIIKALKFKQSDIFVFILIYSFFWSIALKQFAGWYKMCLLGGLSVKFANRPSFDKRLWFAHRLREISIGYEKQKLNFLIDYLQVGIKCDNAC
mgnify:CR=1 FL=1